MAVLAAVAAVTLAFCGQFFLQQQAEEPHPHARYTRRLRSRAFASLTAHKALHAKARGKDGMPDAEGLAAARMVC